MNLSDNAYRWGVLGIVITGTFMAILDSSIVNVALPKMMNTFAVKREQIAWVTTGFMLASAVIMPIVGFLVGKVGHRTLYLWALSIFTVGSAACAFAWNYESLILARILQAIGAGAMQPASMSIIAQLFEPHERGKAMGIWGTGVMVGPALGPTVGGYLTEWFGWRTIFSINIPFGIAALIVGLAIMRSEVDDEIKDITFDWWGFIFLSIALITGLLALNDGQEMGWDSPYILFCLAAATIGLIMFIATESVVKHPLLDLKLLKIRNYSLSMILAVFRSIALFGGLFLLPIFLQSIVGYTAIQAGIWMMPSAVAVGVTMPLAGRMADKYDAKWLVSFGTILTIYSMFVYGNLDPLSSRFSIIGPQIIRGIGIAFMMSPMMTAAINSVPPNQVAMAASFLNVAQRFGGSFGIAMLNTFVSNSITRHATRAAELIGTQTEAFQRFSLSASYGLSRIALGEGSSSSAREIMVDSMLKNLHAPPSAAGATGMMIAYQTLLKRASVLGFDNAFVLAGWLLVISLPLCLLIKRGWYDDGSGDSPKP